MQYIYRYFCIVTIMIFCVNISTNGQIKQKILPNFQNPFKHQQKKNNLKKGKKMIIKPANTRFNVSNFKTNPKPEIKTRNGSFFKSFEKQNINKSSVKNRLGQWFQLSSGHTFEKVSEKTDSLGITHTNYQQFYKGFPVEGGLVMIHSEDDKITAVNGQIAEFNNINTSINITNSNALQTAKSYLNVTDLINEYPVDTVIGKIPGDSSYYRALTFKLRIDSYEPFEMCNIYVNAQTGEVINKINLHYHADTTGTAETLYSGTQEIICDSHNGKFRLRDNKRGIETYNATSARVDETQNTYFVGATDYTNASTDWTGHNRLNSLSISSISQDWWYSFFADQDPDLYIKIINGYGVTVKTTDYKNNINPAVTFNNLNVLLLNPPYIIEVWDYDDANNDDFGGEFIISNTAGNLAWATNGNTGSYSIEDYGHPALDVHWGMQVTYDFYKDVFNRDSYDNEGSVIKNYINPPTLQSQYGYSPNNAGAFDPPYNVMQYGMGDGQKMDPVVGLDVEGHEFTHMVINHNGNGGLEYQGESGALNESFADIFGACIEFYSGVNSDWLIGEDIMISAPFMRSMANPNSENQPDTYEGTGWVNPANTSVDNDHGGVHTNSGVQNYWFYLLSEGGSGTNDDGNDYTVNGIGIEDARQIAYRNLVTYLGPQSTYMDAYHGSLQAAEDLFGNPSTQYNAVKAAWYAVGIGNSPDRYCSGTTELTAASGSFSDGSGSANYDNNTNCKWVIAPSGATQISLNFTSFDTENEYDSVIVYDGPDETYPVLATWYGSTLPQTISTSQGTGAMCVQFKSDGAVNDSGWSADYSSNITTEGCEKANLLTTSDGSFDDGTSSNQDYGNNQLCVWYIAPPCASSVTLNFSSFNTENEYDGVVILDSLNLNTDNQLATLSGSDIPSSVTSSTGKMAVIFTSDYSNTYEGFSAYYTSTGSASCAGTTNLNTSDFGIFSDGSGNDDYCNNLDCKWLIEPPQATSVTLNFSEFNIESSSQDGKTVNDVVKVYDGTSTDDSLLGSYTGDNIPPSVTSSEGAMLVTFSTNTNVKDSGWSAYYTSKQPVYCSGADTLTSESGTFSDGSGDDQYANNSNCSWLIQPENAGSITLSFSSFNTEENYDGIIVYDGSDTTASVLGSYSGTNIPPDITAYNGSMYVRFLSDIAVRSGGWQASYETSPPTSLSSEKGKNGISIYPNPNNGNFFITSSYNFGVKIDIVNMVGEKIIDSYTINKGRNRINVSGLSNGIYFINYKIDSRQYVKKLIIK